MNWIRRIIYFGRKSDKPKGSYSLPECKPPPMPPCKPPRKSEKEIALKRIRYLKNHLPEVRDSIQSHALDMAESSILTGKPHGLCLAHFDNLERICREVEMAIENIKGE